MMRTLLLVAMIAGPAAACAEQSSNHAVAPRREPIPLFNGRNLDGWTTWLVDSRRKDPRGVYSVVDGMIRISGDGLGYLSTKRSHRDYHLVVDFRWGGKNWGQRKGKARDSGIFLHGIGPDGNSYDGKGAFKAAVECQVMQGAVGDLMLIKGRDEAGRDVPLRATFRVAGRPDADGWPFWRPDGKPHTLRRWGRVNWRDKDPAWRDVLGFRGGRDVESPADQWTRVECICRGDRIRVLVNGRQVNEARDVFPAAGKLLLQCEGSEVFFRKVELRPLPDE